MRTLLILILFLSSPVWADYGDGQWHDQGQDKKVFQYIRPVLNLVAGTPMEPDRPVYTNGAGIFSVSPALPAGLYLDMATGLIGGTPSARAVIASYTITAAGPNGPYTTTIQISVDHLRAVAKHLIFANYMVCFAKEGATVEGYEKEILEARAMGLDGWALDMGGYDVYPYYAERTILIFQALQELHLKNFFVFFDPEPGTQFSAASIVNLVKQYADTPNYFTYEGKPFLTAWTGVPPDPSSYWEDQVLAPLKAAGYEPYFAPCFIDAPPAYQNAKLPWYESIIQTKTSTLWKQALDGYYFFATAELPYASNNPYWQQPEPHPGSFEFAYSHSSLIADGEALAQTLHAEGKTFLGGISLSYWGRIQTNAGRRYFQYQGGEGLDTQWRSIILKQNPDWMMVVTWNDFNESYTCPVDTPISNGDPEPPGFYYTHADYWNLSQHYFDWYRTGFEPRIKQDEVYYFYNTQPQAAVATADPLGPVTDFYGTMQDVIYVTSLLTAPAELTVTTGSNQVTVSLAAGLHHTRVPFQPGTQTFSLKRNGREIMSDVSSQDIMAQPQVNNFFYVIGHLESNRK